MTKPNQSRKPKRLLVDQIAPSLEQRSAAWLQQHPPTSARSINRTSTAPRLKSERRNAPTEH
jgi:hypothetical protein